jgi:hypothetical protein
VQVMHVNRILSDLEAEFVRCAINRAAHDLYLSGTSLRATVRDLNRLLRNNKLATYRHVRREHQPLTDSGDPK